MISVGSVAAESTRPACVALPVRSSTSSTGASHIESANRPANAAVRYLPTSVSVPSELSAYTSRCRRTFVRVAQVREQ